jgi:cytoskeletal protein CcmA (bactofilin family)
VSVVRKTGLESLIPPAPKTETTYIDHGCEATGTLRFRGNARIDGHIEGEIHAEKIVIAGEETIVCAQIRAADVIVHGTVEGMPRPAQQIGAP